MMQQEGHGALMTSPITKHEFRYLGFAFVDDTDNCATGSNPEEAIQNMQALLDAWEAGSRVTGGKLVPQKKPLVSRELLR
jgi:predicted RNase H-like HicB family nuclease